MFPFSVIQFAPEGVDSSLTLKAGIATAVFERLADAPTVENKTAVNTAPRTINGTNLFTPLSSLRRCGVSKFPPVLHLRSRWTREGYRSSGLWSTASQPPSAVSRRNHRQPVHVRAATTGERTVLSRG